MIKVNMNHVIYQYVIVISFFFFFFFCNWKVLNLTRINPNLKILTVFYSKNFGILVLQLQKWIVGYLRMVWKN